MNLFSLCIGPFGRKMCNVIKVLLQICFGFVDDNPLSYSYKWYKSSMGITLFKSGRLTPGPDIIKLFSCSTQLRLKYILLINVKMPTIVGILTFMSRINYSFLGLEPEFSNNFDNFNIDEQLKFHALLS